jgi:hypothetical protein
MTQVPTPCPKCGGMSKREDVGYCGNCVAPRSTQLADGQYEKDVDQSVTWWIVPVAMVFYAGMVFGRATIHGEPTTAKIQAAAGGAIFGGLIFTWGNLYYKYRNWGPPGRRQEPGQTRSGGFLRAAAVVTPRRVLVACLGLVALLSLLLFSLLPYRAVNDRGEAQRCGSVVVETIRDDGVLRNGACRAEASRRTGLLGTLSVSTIAGVAAFWLLLGRSGARGTRQR